MFTLLDLPESIFTELQDRYRNGVSSAESTFEMNQADEDCLTGALGQALATPSGLRFSSGSRDGLLKISHTKLRGRGRGAPEKFFGSDGIFQIEVLDNRGRTLFSKGLPFQSKKNWTRKLSSLRDQALQMEQHTPGGIVIDFRKDEYSACSAKVAADKEGSRKDIPMKNLGNLLATDFLNCKIGTIGLFFDAKQEKYFNRKSDFHVITTEVELL